MAAWYTNKNTKVTDEQVLFILSQFKTIDVQKRVLIKSKEDILKSFNITKSALSLRTKSLKKRWIIT